MVCQFETWLPVPDGKTFILMVLQAARTKQRPHTVGGLPS